MKLLVLFTILILGFITGFVVNTFTPLKLTGFFTKTEDVSLKIENLYELVNPGIDVTVVKIDEVSGMYKILFKAVDASGATTYSEVYVTKDGELMTENMILVDQSISQMTRLHSFVDCLDSKGLKIFGIDNQTATVLQFNILGGGYATKLYNSCDGELAQQCVDKGITEVPAIFYEGKEYPGIQSIEFLQNLTGCVF